MEEFASILELSHDPMLVLDKASVLYMNASARKQLPGLAVGESAIGHIPDYILFEKSEQFTSTMALRTREFSVSGVRVEGHLFLSLQPLEKRPRGFVSDGLLLTMKSALFNIGLSIQRISERSGDTAESAQYLAIMQHSYHVLFRHISNLSFALELQNKTVLLDARRIDLVPFCRDLTDAVRDQLGEGKATLEFTTPLPAVMACVDQPKLERLLLNLLTNSYAHCGADGHIQLRLSTQGENAVLTVQDNGSGIPAEVLEDVFSRFEQRMRGEAFSQQPGSGLGLGISRGIAQLHGGALIIESRPGEGTTVRVLLPLEQPGMDQLKDPGVPWADVGWSTLLTELADLLDYRSYDKPRKG